MSLAETLSSIHFPNSKHFQRSVYVRRYEKWYVFCVYWGRGGETSKGCFVNFDVSGNGLAGGQNFSRCVEVASCPFMSITTVVLVLVRNLRGG
jgi:hypothetical protein